VIYVVATLTVRALKRRAEIHCGRDRLHQGKPGKEPGNIAYDLHESCNRSLQNGCSSSNGKTPRRWLPTPRRRAHEGVRRDRREMLLGRPPRIEIITPEKVDVPLIKKNRETHP